MSVEKAKELLQFLIKNPDITEKMKGFTHEELKEAAEELKKEGKKLDFFNPSFVI
jgi:hypothetical protein